MKGKSALSRAIRLLGAREYGVEEIRERLSRDFPPRDVAETVRILVQRGLLDDARYAAWIVERAFARGRGRLAAQADLARRRIPREIADAALAEVGTAKEREAAEQFLKRRGMRLPAPARAARLLASRGFTGGTIRQVTEAHEESYDSVDLP